METITRFLIITAFCLGLVRISVAQVENDSTLYRVETKDGNNYTGQIITRDSAAIKLLDEKLGEISIKKTDIVGLIIIDKSKLVDGKYWPENPHSSRYFWAPNAYGLKAGEGYYQNAWIFFNQAIVGVTENISFGGGLIPVFLLGAPGTPVWLTTKLTFPVVKDQLNMGGGALVGAIAGAEEAGGYGILYGITTIGNRDYNLNLGIGYGYAGEDWAEHPIFNISTMLRTGEKGYFMSENYIIPTEYGTFFLFSLGGRQLIKKVGLDYGLLIPVEKDMEQIIGWPWLGLYIPFGKKPGTVLK